MRTRYKTYGEFLKGITIVHRKDGGVKVICRCKRYVLASMDMLPWNTKKTRTSFLVRLYINEVLRRINVSPKIERIEKFVLLGTRCLIGGDLCIIVNAYQVVDAETGEVDDQLLAFNVGNPFRTAPFKILKSKVKLK